MGKVRDLTPDETELVFSQMERLKNLQPQAQGERVPFAPLMRKPTTWIVKPPSKPLLKKTSDKE